MHFYGHRSFPVTILVVVTLAATVAAHAQATRSPRTRAKTSRSLASAHWPQFRGPSGQGVSDARGLPVTWSANQNLLWRMGLPGAGSSSPIVVGDRLFLTCYSGYGVRGQDRGEMNQLKRHVLCVNTSTGKLLWKIDVPAVLPESPTVREHGYASSTPACDGKRLYVFFGKSGVFAFDFNGRQLWKANVGDNHHGWGSAASPVLYKNLVIINACVESESLVALDKKTGRVRWRARGIKESWNTPLIVTNTNGRSELVVAIAGKILAFDPDTGGALWNCETEIKWYMAPSVVARAGVVYSIGGRGGVAALAVRTGGRGDVTRTHRLDDGTYLYARDAKNRLRRVTRKSDSVVVGQYAYDAFGRRIRRVFIVGTNPAKTVRYYLDDQRVIEEREPDGGGAELLARQYTYGLYLDEALTLDRDLNGDGLGTGPGERLFYHTNTLYSVFGLSDASRNFPERYLYDAYGRPYVWLPGPDGIYGSGDDTFNGQSTIQNARLFTGRERDAESGLLYYRARYSHPRLGRFASRDPLMFDGGDMNLYALVSNQPTNAVDPTGEQIGVQLLKGYACIQRGISAWCICIDWEFNAGWQICCRNNRLTWIKQFKGCLTGFYQPFIIRFSPLFGKPKVVPRVFGPIPAVRPSVPIGPFAAPHVYGQ